MSLSAPPANVSWYVTEEATTVSLPAPASTLSLPAPAVMLSLPAPPTITSLPAPPVKVSLPAPPVTVALVTAEELMLKLPVIVEALIVFKAAGAADRYKAASPATVKDVMVEKLVALPTVTVMGRSAVPEAKPEEVMLADSNP